MSCHILYEMMEYGLTKKKIFEHKCESALKAESTLGIKAVHWELADCVQASTRSHYGSGETVRERLVRDNVQEVRQPEFIVPSRSL